MQWYLQQKLCVFDPSFYDGRTVLLTDIECRPNGAAGFGDGSMSTEAMKRILAQLQAHTAQFVAFLLWMNSENIAIPGPLGAGAGIRRAHSDPMALPSHALTEDKSPNASLNLTDSQNSVLQPMFMSRKDKILQCRIFAADGSKMHAVVTLDTREDAVTMLRYSLGGWQRLATIMDQAAINFPHMLEIIGEFRV